MAGELLWCTTAYVLKLNKFSKPVCVGTYHKKSLKNPFAVNPPVRNTYAIYYIYNNFVFLLDVCNLQWTGAVFYVKLKVENVIM